MAELYKYLTESMFKKSILVLGNGFDLNCKLKSSFKDYYESTILNNQMHFNEKVNSNIWYLLFYIAFYSRQYEGLDVRDYSHLKNYPNTSILWMDIESYIKEIISGDSKGKASNGKHTKNITYILNVAKGSEWTQNQVDDIYLYDYFTYHKLENKGMTYIDLYIYLFNQLKLFEESFAKYIKGEVEERTAYKDKCESLLDKIIGIKDNKSYLIDFNYTGFAIKHLFSKLFGNNIYEVHGDAEMNNVIIGYDSSDISFKDADLKGGLLLSKSWQRLNQEIEFDQLPAKEEVNYIVFYGHSLGEQDYSYFHVLFDRYDLFNSDIKLVFCYSDYEDTETKRAKQRFNYLKDIHALLNDYSIKSGKEQERCTTLVNKLEMEKRIYIRKISED